ncbi:MAG: 1,4-alpha-glucan branching enzyme [Peptococcaceae bacterium]|nr:1,4-alpha-glucan branching enzyme [Peptococcaceae bacterium]
MAPNTFFQEKDALAFSDGRALGCYRGFGAHVVDDGVFFAVWVPGAKRVRVVGDFNQWEDSHNMRLQGSTGVWTLFIKGLGENEAYKYQITTKDNRVYAKSDPFAFYREKPPGTSSVTYRLEGFEWSQEDAQWMADRRGESQQDEDREGMGESQGEDSQQGAGWEVLKEDPSDTMGDDRFRRQPMLIYEVHLGSWKRREDQSYSTYRDLAQELVHYVSDLGYTHIQLMPVMEHLFDASWGYQTSGYYAVSSRYGTPHDFMAFVDACHRAGLGVILDWVPACFCGDERGLSRFNGDRLFEAERQEDYGSLRFDFSRGEVRSFLISNALYFFDMFHIDGIRMDISRVVYKDGAAPEGGREIDRSGVDFVKGVNEVVHSKYPGALVMAQETVGWQEMTESLEEGGLGFDFVWNLGWRSDVLRYVSADFPWRSSNHWLIVSTSMYMFSEHFVLPFSHEVLAHGHKSLIGHQAGSYEQKFAGLRALYCYWLAHPGKKIVFMGTELAQFAAWHYNESLEWHLIEYDIHGKFSAFVQEANRLYRSETALWVKDMDPEGFEWIDEENNEQNAYCFVRRAERFDDLLIVVLNMSPTYYDRFRVGVPTVYQEICREMTGVRSQERFFEEVFNSDASRFGGSDRVNTQALYVDHIPWNTCEESVVLSLPPLACVFLRPGRV